MAVAKEKKARPKAGNGQGTWFHLPNGNIRVEISVRDSSGKAVRKTKTVRGGSGEMGRKNAALRELLDAYPDGKVHDAPQTVGQCMDEWSRHYLHGVALSTKDNYTTQVTKHIKPALGDIALTELTTAKVNSWLRDMAVETAQHKAYSKNAIKLAKKVLAMGLEHARSERRVSENVARDAKVPDAVTRSTRTLTTDEIQRFLTAAQGDRLEAAFLIQLGLGLRLGEALALAWSDIDGDKLHVGHSQRREGGSLIARGAMKSESSQRTLIMPAPVVAAIEAHRDRLEDEIEASLGIWRNPLDLIFTSEDGSPLRPETYRRHLVAVFEKADIPDATSHTLRHSCASHLVESGVPLGAVSDLLGHSDMSMLVKNYRHSTNAVVGGHVAAMDSVLATS